MDIFKFFKNKSGNTSVSSSTPAPTPRLIPTITPDAGLFLAYDKVFLTEMATIGGLAKSDINSMHKIITNGEGKHLNQDRYHRRVFDEFFANRKWNWPWYEKWRDIFSKRGEYPTNWCDYLGSSEEEELEFSEIIGSLKVAQLKELLSGAKITYDERAKKKDLIAAALSTPEASEAIATSALWPGMRDGLSSEPEPEGYGLYTLLMRTIMFRAKSLHDLTRQTKSGITKRTLLIVFPSDRKFVDIALAERPDALPPFFPGDVSLWKAEIPGLR